MHKQQALDLFGGVSKLARALGISPQAVSMWPDGELPTRRANEVLGAAVRLGKIDAGQCADLTGSKGEPAEAA
jgi:hypothetical protein